MKFLFIIILSTFIIIQYKIWIDNDGLNKINYNKENLLKLKKDFQELKKRNLALEKEINDLKNSDEAIIEIARQNLGYIKKGEVYYKFSK